MKRAVEVGRQESEMSGRRGMIWILVAFGFLVAGLVAGTILYAWRREIGWIPPVACFAGYILAFRRGMLLWNPGIDRSWRPYFWIAPSTPDSAYPSGAIVSFPAEPSCPPPSPKLRIVR